MLDSFSALLWHIILAPQIVPSSVEKYGILFYNYSDINTKSFYKLFKFLNHMDIAASLPSKFVCSMK